MLLKDIIYKGIETVSTLYPEGPGMFSSVMRKNTRCPRARKPLAMSEVTRSVPPLVGRM